METEILINITYGGFGLSEKVHDKYYELTGKKLDEYSIKRHDKNLIQVVKEIGLKESASSFCLLEIVKTKDILYRIQEYDGLEYIETPSSINWTVIDTSEAKEKYPEYFI